MTLQRNVAGQNFTFALINVTNDTALTGATVTIKVSIDGGAQAASGGTITELGHGAYNYAPTQGETNGACCSFFITAASGGNNAVPEDIFFLTAGGLHINRPNQHITFSMMTTSGVPDTAALSSLAAFVSKDGGAQAAGTGTFSALGGGQYDYSPTASETNAVNEASFLFSATGDVIQNVNLFVVP